jgi:hypothetical protein
MGLTPEELQRIYEEEKARFEARQRVEREAEEQRLAEQALRDEEVPAKSEGVCQAAEDTRRRSEAQGGTRSEAQTITNEALTRERNIFLVGFVVRVVVAQVGGWALDRAGETQNVAALAVAARVPLIYLVFRLSRFLDQPWWYTLLYCLLAPFSVLYLVPFIGLLVGVRSARRKVDGSARTLAEVPEPVLEVAAEPEVECQKCRTGVGAGDDRCPKCGTRFEPLVPSNTQP